MSNKNDVKVVGKTKDGKEIGYRNLNKHCQFEAAFKSGGKLPDKLKGPYTNVKLLINLIQAYIETTKLKKVKNSASS